MESFCISLTFNLLTIICTPIFIWFFNTTIVTNDKSHTIKKVGLCSVITDSYYLLSLLYFYYILAWREKLEFLPFLFVESYLPFFNNFVLIHFNFYCYYITLKGIGAFFWVTVVCVIALIFIILRIIWFIFRPMKINQYFEK